MLSRIILEQGRRRTDDTGTKEQTHRHIQVLYIPSVVTDSVFYMIPKGLHNKEQCLEVVEKCLAKSMATAVHTRGERFYQFTLFSYNQGLDYEVQL